MLRLFVIHTLTQKNILSSIRNKRQPLLILVHPVHAAIFSV